MVVGRGGGCAARRSLFVLFSLVIVILLILSILSILLYFCYSCSFLFAVFCVFVFFFCSHWSLVDVPLIFFCPADHVPEWQPRVLLGMVEARSVNVKKTTTTESVVYDPLSLATDSGYVFFFIILYLKNPI